MVELVQHGSWIAPPALVERIFEAVGTRDGGRRSGATVGRGARSARHVRRARSRADHDRASPGDPPRPGGVGLVPGRGVGMVVPADDAVLPHAVPVVLRVDAAGRVGAAAACPGARWSSRSSRSSPRSSRPRTSACPNGCTSTWRSGTRSWSIVLAWFLHDLWLRLKHDVPLDAETERARGCTEHEATARRRLPGVGFGRRAARAGEDLVELREHLGRSLMSSARIASRGAAPRCAVR